MERPIPSISRATQPCWVADLTGLSQPVFVAEGFGSAVILGAALLLAILLPLCATAEVCGDRGLYCEKADLVETMLATREKHTSWLTRQKEVRQAVTRGPWRMAVDDRIEIGAAAVDFATTGKDGKPQWLSQAGWKDGTILSLSGAGATVRSALLGRTLTASKPVTLTAGLGGGDRMEVWLNGKKVAAPATHLETKRYGCSVTLDGDRQNQVLLDLSLEKGENQLLVRLRQERVDPRREPLQFFFSSAPDPVPGFWTRLRRDFPPARNPLLELANFEWFERGGWFDAGSDNRFERALLATLGAEPGPAPSLAECANAANRFVAARELAKIRQAVKKLGEMFPDRYPAKQFLQQIEECEIDLARSGFPDLEPLRRRMLVEANPYLSGQKILFARRHTYDSQHYYDDYYHGPTEWGGNLTELDPATGETRDIAPALDGGIFDRYDVSPDGRRVVFGYRPCKPDGYRIWEANLDGTGLRQLTSRPDDEDERIARHSEYPMEAIEKDPRLYGHWTDDMHPCYLPDGRIVFVSSRSERTVLCGGHALTCTNLYRMDADGGNLYQLSQGALTESTPTMLADGRVLYTRWEYVYKGIAAVQSLWAVRPDGTGSEEIYGHNIDNPGVFFAGRQAPGNPDLIVATGCGHEPLAVGSILLIDRAKDRRSKEAMTSLTPNTRTEGLRGLHQFRNGRWNENDVYGPFYTDPFPLSEDFFLVSCNPDKRYNDLNGYGIHLMDTFGNRVEIYRDPVMSCFQPMLPAARQPAAVIPDMTGPNEEGEATVFLTDLYRGLDGAPRGAVKYLRVMEQIPRSWVASQIRPGDSVRGQAPAISLHTHIWVGVLLGVVPVEEDGSACFRVPARRNLYFQALDENFMEVQKMRSFVNFQPGETRSCVGCHDPRSGTPPPRTSLAMLEPPRRMEPQPGDSGPRPIHYPSDVQPILDAHCVSCHGGKEPDGKLDLSGELTEHFNRSYENLLCGDLVNFIQEWTGPEPGKGGPSHVPSGSMMFSPAVPAYTFGSHKSRLVEMIREGHHDVALSREEFIRLVTWVDANAPYYGSYFGLRNIAHRNHPAFRPAPTLASARGCPPPPYRPPELPAQPIASLKAGPGGQLPSRFDGSNPAPGGVEGKEEAVSVAMWVRPESLGNRWNPLLFTDGVYPSAFHFSLLEDGTPNLAVNQGGKTWHHSRANSAVTPGAWRHVAVVCDPRIGGQVQFFLDGKPAGSQPLDLGMPVDLSAFHVGAWSSWEKSAANNFHGQLDDVRIYRGNLTEEEIAKLAEQRPGRISAAFSR